MPKLARLLSGDPFARLIESPLHRSLSQLNREALTLDSRNNLGGY